MTPPHCHAEAKAKNLSYCSLWKKKRPINTDASASPLHDNGGVYGKRWIATLEYKLAMTVGGLENVKFTKF
jgi:hypothetical protein